MTVTPIETDIDTETQTAPAARESANDAFEEFLLAFPRRDDNTPRAPALAAWRKAIAAGADPARVVAGAKAYAASVASRERRFVVSAARWLAEERWPRDPPAPAVNAARIETTWVSRNSPQWVIRAARGLQRPNAMKRPDLGSTGGPFLFASVARDRDRAANIKVAR